MYTLALNNDNGPVTFFVYNMKGVVITQLINQQNE